MEFPIHFTENNALRGFCCIVSVAVMSLSNECDCGCSEVCIPMFPWKLKNIEWKLPFYSRISRHKFCYYHLAAGIPVQASVEICKHHTVAFFGNYRSSKCWKEVALNNRHYKSTETQAIKPLPNRHHCNGSYTVGCP